MRADGTSIAVITAQVYDSSGNPVADGTVVRFTTNGGRIDRSLAPTQGGVARINLTAADQPGVAQIVAVLDTPGDAVPASLTVTFSSEADATQTGASWVRIDGAQVGYVLDYATIQASGSNGGAHVSFRTFTLHADLLQIDTKTNTLLAIGDVTIHQGGATRMYRDLKWQILEGTGLGDRIDADGLPHIYTVSGAHLDEKAPGPEAPHVDAGTWKLGDMSNGQLVIVAHSIDLEPNEHLRVRRATFWVNGTKAWTLPFHVLDLRQGTLFEDQIIGYGPTGVSFDLPIYYDVDPSDVGAVHLRRGATVGSASYSVRPIWSLDLVHAYNGPNGEEGKVELDGVTREDWSARLQHGQRLDRYTTGNLYVDFPNNKDLFVNSQVSRQFKTFHLDVSGSGTRSGGVVDPVTGIKGSAGGGLSGQLSAQTFARPFWDSKILNYTLTTGVSRQGYYGGTTAVSQGTLTTRTAGGTLDSVPLPVGPGNTFRQSFVLGQSWVTTSANGGESADGLSIRGTSAFNHSLGKVGTSSLTYDYTQAPSLAGLGSSYGGIASAGTTAKHRVGASVYLMGGRLWTLNVSGSQGLDIDQSTLFSNLRVNLSKVMSVGANLSQTRLSGFTYREIQYSVTRNYSGKDFTLSYSTTAKKVFFNFAGIPL